MNLKISFKNGTYYIVGDSKGFLDTYEAPCAYFQLFKDEKYWI